MWGDTENPARTESGQLGFAKLFQGETKKGEKEDE